MHGFNANLLSYVSLLLIFSFCLNLLNQLFCISIPLTAPGRTKRLACGTASTSRARGCCISGQGERSGTWSILQDEPVLCCPPSISLALLIFEKKRNYLEALIAIKLTVFKHAQPASWLIYTSHSNAAASIVQLLANNYTCIRIFIDKKSERKKNA